MTSLVRCLRGIRDQLRELVVEVVCGTPAGVHEVVSRLSGLRSELNDLMEKGEDYWEEEREEVRLLVGEIKELQSNLLSVIRDSQDFLRYLYETLVMVEAPAYDRDGGAVKELNILDRRV